MSKILIVEDNIFFAKVMEKSIVDRFAYVVDVAGTAEEAREKLAHNKYELIVVDLILPDSEGEFIEELCSGENKIIVTTDFEDEFTRKKITSLDIVDYIIKSDSPDFSYLLNVIHRINTNESITVLIVEDSLTVRNHISQLLHIQCLNVITATDGLEALDMIKEHPNEIDLVITDYNMPNMDGLELLRELRRTYSINQLPIITLSALGTESIIARFLKAGANDYIMKPFSKEEFFCRINLSLNNLEMLKSAQKAASTDHLTGLHNRYYMQSRLVRLAKDKNKINALAIVDIDHFKNINDTFGHHTGDLALKFFAIHLLSHFDMENIIRMGGEEFLVILPGMSNKKAVLSLEGLREEMQNAKFTDENGSDVKFTISAGVAQAKSGKCDSAIKEADEYLYKAKKNGRNRIEFEGSTK
ncbi:response regulator [Sulfurimonas sp. MAG313]|nr:response regulator [Sulfurimonas sp. MAG313]MDF1881875.1 response regulator [Sulfurimonas sp. MAG313]